MYVCAVTHRAKPYQLALLIKKSLDESIGTQQSAREVTLQNLYQSIHSFLIYAFFPESSIDTLMKMCILYDLLKLPLCASFNALRTISYNFV